MSWRDTLLRELRLKCSILRGKRILVELPEGLRSLEETIEGVLRSCGAREITFRLESSYGACDTSVCDVGGLFDVVLNIGHVPYALRPIHSCRNTKLVTIPLILDESVYDDNIYEKVLDILYKRGWRRVGLGFVHHYSKSAHKLRKLLEEHGIRVYAGHVLGCYFSGLERLDVDAYIVLGSRFHALGLGLAVHAERDILLVEPEGRLIDYSGVVRRELQKRYWVASSAANAKTWGIVAGAGGQCRPVLITIIANALRVARRKVRFYTSRRIRREELDSIEDVEVFVVTSCPRVAIEDLSDYHRPVLTPGEVLYALGYIGRVRFPW